MEKTGGAAGTEWEAAYLHTRRSSGRRRRLVASLPFPDRGLVLDLGCGDGLNLPLLRARGLEPVAFDFSRFLLQRTAGLRVQGRSEQLPFAANTCAAIFIDSVLHHVDWRATLREAGRVLAADGVLAIIEPRPTASRRAFDGLTFSPVAKLVPLLRRRNAALRGELVEYRRWLADYPEFMAVLRREWQVIEMREELMRTVAVLKRQV